VEIIKPRFERAMQRKKESSETVAFSELFKEKSLADANKSPAEQQYEKNAYDSTFDDWDEIVVQYGYVSLFVVAFPIAPMIAMISNAIENRVDSYKLCVFHRRPMPKGAQNIGFWYNILDVISWFTVVSNIAIIVFQTDIFARWSIVTRFLIFLFSEHLVIIAKTAISQFIPDMMESTQIHLERQKYLQEVLIQGVQDRGDIEAQE